MNYHKLQNCRPDHPAGAESPRLYWM